MAKYSIRVECQHPGCREVANYEASTRKEQSEIYQRHGRNWFCMRHTRMDETLSPTNLKRTTEVVSRQETYGRFFGHSGFVSGLGFKLFAEDFPAGTTLRVTAEIIPPAVTNGSDRP